MTFSRENYMEKKHNIITKKFILVLKVTVHVYYAYETFYCTNYNHILLLAEKYIHTCHIN